MVGDSKLPCLEGRIQLIVAGRNEDNASSADDNEGLLLHNEGVVLVPHVGTVPQQVVIVFNLLWIVKKAVLGLQLFELIAGVLVLGFECVVVFKDLCGCLSRGGTSLASQ